MSHANPRPIDRDLYRVLPQNLLDQVEWLHRTFQNHTGINHRIRSNQHLTGEDHSIRNPLTIGSLFICQGLTYIRGENWASLGKERSLALSNEGRKLPLVKASFPRPRQAKRRLPKTGAALLDGTVAVPLIFIVPVHAFVVVPQVLWEV
jgi:hypothetical protein